MNLHFCRTSPYSKSVHSCHPASLMTHYVKCCQGRKTYLWRAFLFRDKEGEIPMEKDAGAWTSCKKAFPWSAAFCGNIRAAGRKSHIFPTESDSKSKGLISSPAPAQVYEESATVHRPRIANLKRSQIMSPTSKNSIKKNKITVFSSAF